MRYLRTNTATRITVGPFLDKTDGITPEVALTVTSEKLTFMVDTAGVPTLVIDAAPTASAGDNDMVHVTNDDAGFYDLELTAANVNYLGRAMLAITDAATHCPVFHEFEILPAMVYDSLILGTDLLDVENSAGVATMVADYARRTGDYSTLDAAGVRTATGLASANLDTQLAALPTAAENTSAVWAAVIETGFSALQLLRLISAALAGKLSGAATTTITIRDVNDAKDRIVATVDADGNRSAVTKDVS